MAVALSVHRHNQTVLNCLEEGDMIEFPRGLYSHWAVYIGNGEVVHLAGDEDEGGDGINGASNSGHLFTISGQRFSKAWVKIEDFLKVAGSTKAKINNEKDEKLPALPKSKIMQNALARLGSVGYNVLFENCEHFATWCRYGIGKSEQVETFVKGAIIAGLAAGALWYFSTRNNKAKKNTQY